jgi:hypothetical protein
VIVNSARRPKQIKRVIAIVLTVANGGKQIKRSENKPARYKRQQQIENFSLAEKSRNSRLQSIQTRYQTRTRLARRLSTHFAPLFVVFADRLAAPKAYQNALDQIVQIAV